MNYSNDTTTDRDTQWDGPLSASHLANRRAGMTAIAVLADHDQDQDPANGLDLATIASRAKWTDAVGPCPPPFPVEVVRSAMAALVEAGAAVETGGLYRLTGQALAAYRTAPWISTNR